MSFLTPTLRTYLLTWNLILIRTLIVTSLYNIVAFLTPPAPEHWGHLTSVLSFVIVIHHGLSVWSLQLNPAVFDWLLIFGEIGAWFGLQFYAWKTNRWTRSKHIVLLGSLYVQMIALALLCCIRTISLFQQLPSGLYSPLNLLPPDDNEPAENEESSWTDRLPLLFGRTLWGNFEFMGQGSYGILMVARAVFATASILGVLIFAVFRVIIWPWSETGIVPVKTLVGTDLRWDFQSINPSWNVFVIMDRDLGDLIIDKVLKPDAIQVTPLWEDLDKQVPLCTPIDGPPPQDDRPPCKYMGRKFNDVDPSIKYNTPKAPAVHSFQYSCPNRCTRNLNLLDFMQVPARDTMPDLLVTINFTTLGISPLSSTVGGSRLKAVGVIAAFNDNIHDVLRVSTPTPLFPGMHLFGAVGMEFRSLIVNSKLAALGGVSASHTFIAGSLFGLVPDPAPPSQDATTASLRAYLSTDPSDWHFVQEDRENSVVAGVAAVGGLWMSSDGLFSFFFGGTLALLLWGKKPLAIFGFFDQFWRGTHREKWNVEQLQPPLDDKDMIMIKMLRKEWVDLGPCDK